jgi:hypothetical protein
MTAPGGVRGFGIVALRLPMDLAQPATSWRQMACVARVQPKRRLAFAR